MTHEKPSKKAVRARVQSVERLLKDAAPRIESERKIPDDVLAALHEVRLFRLLLPRSLNGDELDLQTLAEAMELLGSYDASTAWCLNQGAGCAMAAAFLKPDAAQRLFGPANAALAWGAGIQGKARKVPGGYRVTGKWSFASGLGNATLLGGHSYVFEADGAPTLAEDGTHYDRTLLFARDKAQIHDVWQVLGLSGTASNSFETEDLFVPEDETIDRQNKSERFEKAVIFGCPITIAFGVGFAALQLGIARGMIDDLLHLATTKTPRAAPSPLRDNATFHTQLGILEARYRAARAFLHETAVSTFETVASGVPTTEDDWVKSKLATAHVINESVELSVEAYRAAGSSAIFVNRPFERRLRDALSASQQIQGRASNYTTAGRVLLGLKPDIKLFL